MKENVRGSVLEENPHFIFFLIVAAFKLADEIIKSKHHFKKGNIYIINSTEMHTAKAKLSHSKINTERILVFSWNGVK